jgi:hypothetical protein
MQDTLSIAMRFWSDFLSWTPPQLTLYVIVGFSALSAWIMTWFAARPPLFVGPLSFVSLAFAAMMANFAGRSYVMMGTSDVQKVLLFCVIGHAVAGIFLMGLFKASGDTRSV